MAFDFPSSPTVGQIYLNYTWDGEKWTSSTGQGVIYVSDSPPSAPPGSLWWESDTGLLYVRFDDGNSVAWISIATVGAGAVRFDAAQTLTDDVLPTTKGQKTQARQNIAAAPFDAIAFNGIQINGSGEVGQEVGAAQSYGGVGGTTINKPMCDGWRIQSVGAQSISWAAAGGGFPPPAGYVGNLGLWLNITNPTPGVADYLMLSQTVEGCRILRLAWGSLSAQPMSIGFWFFSTAVGTYSVAIRNGNATRSYIANFTVFASATWEWKTITIPGCVDGTWAPDNAIGLNINFVGMTGANFQAPSANAWVTGNYLGTAATINACAGGNKFAVTGLIMLPGLELPPASRAAFIARPFDQEWALCQRYYEKTYPYGDIPGKAYAGNSTANEYTFTVWLATGYAIQPMRFSKKRVTPTVTLYSPYTGISPAMRVVGLNDVPAYVQSLGESAATAVVNNTSIAGVANVTFHAVIDARF